MAKVPQPADKDGKPTGSVTAQLASWCVKQNLKVDFYSFDFEITDFAWRGLNSDELIRKLEAVKDTRHALGLGDKYWSKVYVEAYIDLLKSGGDLIIKPHVTSALLYDLLEKGPILANVASPVMNDTGRAQYPEPDTAKRLRVPDDINGYVGNHSIVIYGNDEEGRFLVADPWDGMRVLDPEALICAITAAVIECDSQCFQISPK